jgi:hypothetical protein
MMKGVEEGGRVGNSGSGLWRYRRNLHASSLISKLTNEKA